jgi:hypothetical protein
MSESLDWNAVQARIDEIGVSANGTDAIDAHVEEFYHVLISELGQKPSIPALRLCRTLAAQSPWFRNHASMVIESMHEVIIHAVTDDTASDSNRTTRLFALQTLANLCAKRHVANQAMVAELMFRHLQSYLSTSSHRDDMVQSVVLAIVYYIVRDQPSLLQTFLSARFDDGTTAFAACFETIQWTGKHVDHESRCVEWFGLLFSHCVAVVERGAFVLFSMLFDQSGTDSLLQNAENMLRVPDVLCRWMQWLDEVTLADPLCDSPLIDQEDVDIQRDWLQAIFSVVETIVSLTIQDGAINYQHLSSDDTCVRFLEPALSTFANMIARMADQEDASNRERSNENDPADNSDDDNDNEDDGFPSLSAGAEQWPDGEQDDREGLWDVTKARLLSFAIGCLSAPKESLSLGAARLIGLLVYRNPKLQQDAVRCGAVPLLLQQCRLSKEHPILREWCVLAIRNLAEDNQAVQDYIRDLQLVEVQDSDWLQQAGMEAFKGEDGRVRIRKRG